MDTSCMNILDPVKGALGQAIVMLISALYTNVMKLGNKNSYPRNQSDSLIGQTNPVYDFVIIGSSTPGCILSNRLSEYPEYKILLIEAGGYPSATTDVPYLFFTLESSEEDWAFSTTEENFACQGFIGERCLISRGKVLGGTSSINNMHYHRGNLYDYDKWGLKEWLPKKILSYFDNLEHYMGETGTTFEVGTKGNLTLTYFKSGHFLRLPLSKMYRSAGYKPLRKGMVLGYRDILVSSWKSQRMHISKMFLNSIKDRPNLHLALSALATRIIFHNNTVKGVEIVIGETTKFITVRKELILTGGPFNNVKLLHRSGIGPRKILEGQNIPVIADLPVGSNLQMHLRVPLFVAIDKCCGQCLNCSTEDCQDDYFTLKDFYQNTWDYIMDRIGPFTNIGINDFVAYISTSNRRRDKPNIAVYHTYFKRNDFFLKHFLENRRYHPAIAASVLKFNKVRNLLLFHPTLLSPESRGEVYINTTNHLIQPVIKPNFLTDENNVDFRAIYAAVTMIVSLTDSIPMQRYKAKFLNIDIPNCRNFKFCSHYYFKCLILNLGGPPKTCCGTCKVGKPEDNDTVVDANFEMKSIEGLRIADHSIVPFLGAGKAHSTSIFPDRLTHLLNMKWSESYKNEKLEKKRKRKKRLFQ